MHPHPDSGSRDCLRAKIIKIVQLASPRKASVAKLAQAAPIQEYRGMRYRFIPTFAAEPSACAVSRNPWRPEPERASPALRWKHLNNGIKHSQRIAGTESANPLPTHIVIRGEKKNMLAAAKPPKIMVLCKMPRAKRSVMRAPCTPSRKKRGK